jgi:hypothetical protein
VGRLALPGENNGRERRLGRLSALATVLERGTGDHSAPDHERDSKQSKVRNADGADRAAHDATKSVPEKLEGRHDSKRRRPTMEFGKFSVRNRYGGAKDPSQEG